MKYWKRVTAAFLTVILGIVTMPVPTLASEANTPKEEVVYINMNQDGSVNEIYVVNIFDLDESVQIVDYGRYESIRNMTTTDEIGYINDKVTINTSSGKLYYEGRLSTNSMPWDIAIHYFMDDNEYPAQEIAGKSGKLRITMSVRQNAVCDSSFFEGYTLQITFLLDTERCSNIMAEGATIANVGSDKQLTYTILPNRETDIDITADVTDFEMDGIAINGVQLNLDIEIEDEELQDKIDDITDAVKEIDEGADSLYEGTSDLYDGVSSLYEGTGTLYEGTESLSDATGALNEKVSELHVGVGELTGGADTLHGGLVTLTEKNSELTTAAWSAYAALCTAAQTQLNAELTANGMEPVTLTPENYAVVLTDILIGLDANGVYEQAYNAALREVTAQVESQEDDLCRGYIQSQAESVYLQYMQSQAESLYVQAATEIVYERLISTGGLDEQQAQEYLQGTEGQEEIARTAASLSDADKEQIIRRAAAQLTDAEKQQILQQALSNLSEDEKTEIRNAYISQMMTSEEVTREIAAAVEEVNTTAAQVAGLKGQLDSYGAFYGGLIAYTAGVSDAAKGADTLQKGLDTLYTNTDTLKTAVGELNNAALELQEGTEELHNGAKELNDGAKELSDGAKELSDGTGEFVAETSGMDSQVSDEIDAMIASVSGRNAATVSFVSEKNTNVKTVQFVIKTEAIQVEEAADIEGGTEEPLNFWQKCLRLFGLY
ncbi:MAG: hypothetical protein ACI4EQ_05455 [Lachnospiraceae bacterium]